MCLTVPQYARAEIQGRRDELPFVGRALFLKIFTWNRLAGDKTSGDRGGTLRNCRFLYVERRLGGIDKDPDKPISD